VLSLQRICGRPLYRGVVECVLQVQKIGLVDLCLAFFIPIWQGSVALKKVDWEALRVSDEPKTDFEIRWWSG